MPNLATIALDRQWLRRIRGKLDEDELQRAKDLADQDVKEFIRELYGTHGDDEDVETILDDDGDPVDIGTVIINDLFHTTGTPDAFDHLTHEYYARFKDLADLIASYYCIQWGDFMGRNDESGESPQDRVVGSNVARKKTEIESIGFVITTSAEATYPSRSFYFRNVVMLKDRIQFRRKTRH